MGIYFQIQYYAEKWIRAVIPGFVDYGYRHREIDIQNQLLLIIKFLSFMES